MGPRTFCESTGDMAYLARPMDFCFVHAADLHLGGRRWLRSAPTDARIARSVSQADRLALRSLVDLCLEERAKMLLCSGDVIDGWCRNHQVGLVLVQELLRLRDGGCDVVLLLGNHDVRTRVMKPLLLPQHAFVLGLHGPETRVLERLGVALHAGAFPSSKRPWMSLHSIPRRSRGI
jgi:DNA repair exonuclease SbcCD nuclease subunit